MKRKLDLLNMKFKGIGLFVDEQFVDFSKLDQLNQIDGFNKNTGGSSGAAKTTIIKALAYLWGVEKTPATRLQSRFTKEKLYVIAEHTYQGQPLIIKRSTKDKLEMWIGEEKKYLNRESAEEKLLEMMGVESKVWSELIHKKQKGRGYFLKLSPLDKYKLMLKLLGLEGWQTKIDDATERISQIDEKIAECQKQVESNEKRLEERREELKERQTQKPEFVNYDMDIMRLESEIENLRKERLQKEREIGDAKAMIPKPTPNAQVADRTILNQIIEKMNRNAGLIHEKKVRHEEHTKTLNDEFTRINNSLNLIAADKLKITEHGKKAREIFEEIKHLKSNSCPTCKREWVGEDLNAKITMLETEFNTTKQAIEMLQSNVAAESDYRGQLAENERQRNDYIRNTPWLKLQEEWNELNAQKAKEEERIDSEETDTLYLTRMNEYNETLRRIETQGNNDVNAMKVRATELESELRSAQNNKNNYQSRVQDWENSIMYLEKKIKEAEGQVIGNKSMVEKCEEGKKTAEEGVRVMRSFTIQKFKDSLDTIAMHANDILSGVPNTKDSHVYFDAFKLQANGVIKEEVTCYVSLNGEPGVPLDTLCGGEETAFELAIDLGFNEMVESEAGIGYSHYFMDEPFDGMDDTCIEELVEMLRGYKTGKKLVVLSHAQAIKELADKTILVEREGNTSYIVSIT